MGLLDDAIREHLDLKRRRGADPGEVAREQREALEPVPRGETAESEEDLPLAADGVAPADAPGAAPGASVPVEADPVQASQREGEPPAPAGGGEETAELDMQSVLGGDEGTPPVEGTSPGPAAEEQAHGSAEAVLEEDSLEWEVPGEVAEEELEEEQPAEDVLEETPDFLRDTPEQERLWFEQRPPRDFDFDK